MPFSGNTDDTSGRQPTGWWTRPCGGRDVFQFAVPLVISMSALTVMQFVDRMFLLWHSKEEMAAAMPAGMVHFVLVCFPMGVASYVNTFVAQYKGAGHSERIGSAVWQGARVGLYCIPLFLAFIPVAPWIFRLAGHSPELAELETLYFQVTMCGAGGFVIASAMSAFFTGLGKTRVVMIVDSTSSLLNVILDYGWIFGHFGLPALGIAGAGWATVVSLWFRVAVYIVLLMSPRYRIPFGLWSGRGYNGPLMRRLFHYGGPNGLQLLVEIGGFSLFLLLVGTLGEDAMAATTLAFNINLLAFMPMLGLGIALSAIVGQQLGKNRPTLAARAAWTALVMAMCYMGTIALTYVAIPDVLMMGHAAGTNPVQFALLRDTTVVLLRFVAAYCLFDAMNLIFASALKGAGDTRFILLVSLFITPFPLLAAWAGIRFAGGGLIWCWVIATAWVSSVGLLYMARFLHGKWRHMRVIEPELLLANGENDTSTGGR
ncbi:MAG: MATE family efflux transporter [Pirellulales bacterium]|nr:MATE family efflux transporter [Pirellulales bacterium]